MDELMESESFARQFASRLVEARGEMSQSDLLRLLREQGVNIRQSSLSHYETGRNYPDPPTMAILAKTLSISTDWWLGLTEEKLPVADLEEQLAAATGEHKINKILRRLPKERQQQVIEFAEYLLAQEQEKARQEGAVVDADAERDWRAFEALFTVLERKFGEDALNDVLEETQQKYPRWRSLLRSVSSEKSKRKRG